jgi:hypothetical protein
MRGSALRFLTRYAQKEGEFLDSIVTGDETWVFHHTPVSKQQSLHSHDDDEVQEEAMTWFKEQAADFYDSGIQKLFFYLPSLVSIRASPSRYTTGYLQKLYN